MRTFNLHRQRPLTRQLPKDWIRSTKTKREIQTEHEKTKFLFLLLILATLIALATFILL